MTLAVHSLADRTPGQRISTAAEAGLRPGILGGSLVGVLFAVSMAEVLLHGAPPMVQATVAASQYGLVVMLALVEARLAILCIIGFTLVSLGAWTHVLAGTDPHNFWGLRVGGVSVNTAFTIGLLGLTTMKRGLRIPRGLRSPPFFFLAAFFVYSLFLGLVRLALGQVYVDNLEKDLAVFLLFPVYWSLCSTLGRDTVASLVRIGIACGITTMATSYVVGERFFYSGTSSYLLLSGFGYVAIFAVVAMADFDRHVWAIPLALVMAALVATGDVFLGAKTIVVLALTVLWRLVGSVRGSVVVLIVAVALVGGVGPLISGIGNDLARDGQLNYKIQQVAAILDPRTWTLLAATPTSAGNVIAEGWTVLVHWLDHPGYMLFGKGFGAGIPDIFGYLTPFAGASGYAAADATRNEFVRLHLPIYEVAVKAGLVGTIVYLRVLFGLLASRDPKAFISAILLATVFTNNKEMMLLTVLFLSATVYERDRVPQVPRTQPRASSA